MTFAERAGIEPEHETTPAITGDAPWAFRKDALKASVDAVGWNNLREIVIKAFPGAIPSGIKRWYGNWDESYDGFQTCEWTVIFDIIEGGFPP